MYDKDLLKTVPWTVFDSEYKQNDKEEKEEDTKKQRKREDGGERKSAARNRIRNDPEKLSWKLNLATNDF